MKKNKLKKKSSTRRKKAETNHVFNCRAGCGTLVYGDKPPRGARIKDPFSECCASCAAKHATTTQRKKFLGEIAKVFTSALVAKN